jgi:hypothetical protein
VGDRLKVRLAGLGSSAPVHKKVETVESRRHWPIEAQGGPR